MLVELTSHLISFVFDQFLQSIYNVEETIRVKITKIARLQPSL